MLQTWFHPSQPNKKEIINYLSLRSDFEVTGTSPANNFEETQCSHVKGEGEKGG